MRNAGEGDDWHRAQAPATRRKEAIARRATPGEGRRDRESGGSGLAEKTETASSRHGLRREVHGDARSCGVLANLIDCRNAKSWSSKSWQGLQRPRLQPKAVGGPPGRTPTVGIGSKRGRREQGAVPAWKRGSFNSFASCGRKDLAARRGAFGKARSTTGPRMNGQPHSRSTPRVTSERQVQRPVQASRDTRASTRGSRLERGPTKIARLESERAREKSMGFTGADRHPSLADCMERHLARRSRLRLRTSGQQARDPDRR